MANGKTISLLTLIIIVSLMVASVNLLPVQVAKADWVSTIPWPGPGQNLNNTGYQPYGTAPTSNATLWNTTLNLYPNGEPSVADGRVFTATNKHMGDISWGIFCLNETTGEQIWNFTPETLGGYSGGVAVADGRIFFDEEVWSGDGHLYCLDEATGTQIWNYTAKFSAHSPQVAYGRVYFGSDALYCLNATDGQSIWNYTPGLGILATPAVVDGKVYIGSEGFTV